MKNFKFQGGLGKTQGVQPVHRNRGANWTRKAKAHKAVHMQCAHCKGITDLQTDHIIPLHKGGSDEWSNLQSLCVTCHNIKTYKDFSDKKFL